MVFFLQAEDGIRDLVRSRGLGDVYKRQAQGDAGGLAQAENGLVRRAEVLPQDGEVARLVGELVNELSLIHI